jgi:Ca-activated chloride channel family protein
MAQPHVPAVRRGWALAPLAGVGLLLLLAAPLQAGPVFVAGQLDGDRFVPAPGVPASWYHIRYSTSDVTVDDDGARVKVEEVVSGPEKAVTSICLIPLPEGADGKDVRVTLGAVGAAPVVLADATFLTPARAQAVYEAVAKGTGSTKLLAFGKRPAILVPRVALEGKAQLTVTFRSPVQRTQGVQWVICPTPAAACVHTPVERLSINVSLRTKEPLRTVFSPTHQTAVQRKGLTEATATVRADRWSGLDDFRLYWVADKDDLGLRVLAFRSSPKEDGYFMLLGNPTGAAAEKAVEKDVVFVLDTSGSMRGEKIEQARSALDYCLEHLNKGDRFNVITFGTTVRSFRDDLVALTPAAQTAARAFVEETAANGQTNISGALEKALAGKAEAGRPRIMIFLTDGAPTVGERVPEKIVEQVKKLNTAGTKIFVMGVGNDVNAHLLDRLAEVTDGSSEYVAPREELDAKVAALYDRLSHPVLSGVRVSFGDASAKSVLPPKVPVLFKGSEIMIVGRYKEGGKHTFTLSGSLSGKPTEYTVVADLPAGASDPANEFLAPLWAARQIGYLLQEIRLHGPNKELIAEVVRLSREYGIVTEYTEFIASAGGRASGGPNAPMISKDAAYAEAAKRLDKARSEQAGQWAVNQAANDRALQNRAVASGEANQYRDRRGNLTAVRNVTLLGRRAFYLQDGQWVDAEEAGTRKVRVVKLFSPEYFELLRADATFAKAQQMSWAVSMNVGDERVVVEKDGKQQDEALRVKPGQPDEEEQGRKQNLPKDRIGPGRPNQLQEPLPPEQNLKRQLRDQQDR